jgi:uncharacterized phage protein (TIGR02220 family)
MADWIKMRTGLLTNPKVIRMSRLLASDRAFVNWWLRGTNKVTCDETVYEICDVTVVTRVTVASLLSVWSAVNDASQEDGFVTGITLIDVDVMAGVDGFGAAMQAVGWLQITDDGILFPNFEEHNTVGKARQEKRSSGAKTAAQRTAEWRARKKQAGSDVTGDVTPSRDVTVTSPSDHREEKRREEKKKDITRDACDVLDHLNSKAGRQFEATPSNTKLIIARMREGATVDRLKAVVDAKVSEWLNDPKMNQYLRPATLFNAEKFGQYSGLLGTRLNGSSIAGEYEDLTRGAL